jgi:uncharacterized protein DUF4124
MKQSIKLNCLLFAVLTSYACLAFSGVYKHVDEHGNVTYSNVRSNDAKKVDLPPIVVVPRVDSDDIDARIKKRKANTKNREQREAIESKIHEESSRLDEIRREYKGGTPDRLGSERNYQRYLDRVERLKNEINVREENLNTLRNEQRNLPDIGR